jgi:hypothetical protein
MDFGLLALGLVLARELLFFVAKRTKNTVDDKAADIARQLPLPSMHDAIHTVIDKKAAPRPPATTTVEGSRPAPTVTVKDILAKRDQRG